MAEKKKKRSLLEAINPFDKESKDRRLMRKGRRAGKKAAKATREMTGFDSASAKKKPAAKKKPSISSALKARRMKRKADKMNKPLKRAQAGKKARGTGLLSTKKSRVKAVGAKAGTKVRRGAVKTKSTKGGDYVKYEKKSKAAGSFRSAFKSGCAKGAKGFSWDGRSYSCAKAGSPKKTKAVKKTTSPAKKPIARGGQGGSSPE